MRGHRVRGGASPLRPRAVRPGTRTARRRRGGAAPGRGACARRRDGPRHSPPRRRGPPWEVRERLGGTQRERDRDHGPASPAPICAKTRNIARRARVDHEMPPRSIAIPEHTGNHVDLPRTGPPGRWSAGFAPRRHVHPRAARHTWRPPYARGPPERRRRPPGRRPRRPRLARRPGPGESSGSAGENASGARPPAWGQGGLIAALGHAHPRVISAPTAVFTKHDKSQ